MSLAVSAWFISFTVAMVYMFFFNTIGLIQTPPLLGAIALSTTALGVLAPILRDRGELNSDFGRYMVAAAAASEFGPMLAISGYPLKPGQLKVKPYINMSRLRWVAYSYRALR